MGGETVRALAGVSVGIARGEFVAILGTSGSGKSTLLNLFGGLDRPTVGEVCCQVTGVDKITSTLSFHLKELRQAGLILMERRGKNMICTINPEAVALLTDYLRQEGLFEGEKNNDCCE